MRRCDGVLIALCLAGAGCTSDDRGVQTVATDTGAGNGSRPITKTESIATINAACTEFYRLEPVDPGPSPSLVQAREYAQARIAAIRLGLERLHASPIRQADRDLSDLVQSNFSAAQLIYRQVADAADSVPAGDVARLMSSGQRLVVEVAGALIGYGATGCVPPVLEPPAPPGAGAGPLVELAPTAVIRVGDPLVDNKSIVADRHAVWVGLGREPSVVRIDPDTDRVVARIALGSRITQQIQIIDGDVWVPTETELVRIDGTTNRINWRMRLDELGPPDSCFTVVGHVVWACDRDVVHRIDIRTRRRSRDVVVPGGAQVVTAAQNHVTIAYGVGLDAFALVRSDLVTGRLGPSVTAPVPSAWGLLETSDGRVFVDSDTIVEVDVGRSRVVRSIARAGSPGNHEVLVGDVLWTLRPDEQRLVRYDLRSNSLSEVRGGPGVNGIAYRDGWIWATNSDAGTVTRFAASGG